jgi:hypothetical protein
MDNDKTIWKQRVSLWDMDNDKTIWKRSDMDFAKDFKTGSGTMFVFVNICFSYLFVFHF